MQSQIIINTKKDTFNNKQSIKKHLLLTRINPCFLEIHCFCINELKFTSP